MCYFFFLDFAKAFDCVDYQVLPKNKTKKKLKHYGVLGKAYDLLISFLSNRLEFNVNEMNSFLPSILLISIRFLSFLALVYIKDLTISCNLDVMLYANDLAMICNRILIVSSPEGGDGGSLGPPCFQELFTLKRRIQLRLFLFFLLFRKFILLSSCKISVVLQCNNLLYHTIY